MCSKNGKEIIANFLLLQNKMLPFFYCKNSALALSSLDFLCVSAPLQPLLSSLSLSLLPDKMRGKKTLLAMSAAAAAVVSSAASSSTSSSSWEEARRYASLPPTVFAPGGRLHGVERVAREAIMADADEDDDGGGGGEASSSSVFAMRCRRRCRRRRRGPGGGGTAVVLGGADTAHDDEGEEEEEEEEEEFAVMVGIGPMSPYLHRDHRRRRRRGRRRDCDDDDDERDNDRRGPTEVATREGADGGAAAAESGGVRDATTTTKTARRYLPLAIDDDDDVDVGGGPSSSSSSSSSSAPIAILSPTLVAGAGGRAIDSSMLLRRAIEVALASYAADDGGLGWFVSHSLEGLDGGGDGMMAAGGGGTSGVDATYLARRVADIAQVSTQALGGRYGRMLSVSGVGGGGGGGEGRHTFVFLHRPDLFSRGARRRRRLSRAQRFPVPLSARRGFLRSENETKRAPYWPWDRATVRPAATAAAPTTRRDDGARRARGATR